MLTDDQRAALTYACNYFSGSVLHSSRLTAAILQTLLAAPVAPAAAAQPDERAAFEAIAHWKDMTPFAWFQQGWKVARAVPAQAAEPVAVPAGWKLVRVNEHFDALITSLERAESKGYLPDSVREEWENFACDENVIAPQPPEPADERAAFEALRYIDAQLTEYLEGMPADETTRKLRDVARNALAGSARAASTATATDESHETLHAIQAVLREVDPKWPERGEFGVKPREQIISAIRDLARAAAPQAGLSDEQFEAWWDMERARVQAANLTPKEIAARAWERSRIVIAQPQNDATEAPACSKDCRKKCEFCIDMEALDASDSATERATLAAGQWATSNTPIAHALAYRDGFMAGELAACAVALKAVASAREDLEGIRRYGLDTLSGRADGQDDREWQRDGVNEMTKRARLAIERIDNMNLAEQSADPMAGETRAAAPQAASTPPTPYHWRDTGPLETGEPS
jgi:hypothetical protein